MATLPLADGSAGSLNGTSTTNAQQKTNFVNLRTFLADLFGTDSANKLAARSALGVTAAIQNQTDSAFTTTGTSIAYVLTPTTAATSYVTNQKWCVTFHTSSGATPTINVSGLGAKSLKQYDSTGTKVAAVVYTNQISNVIYDGTDFVVTDAVSSSGGTLSYQVFTASGTWTKPAGYGSSARALIEAWGGGGGGANSGGGGGGAYVTKWFLLSDLGATETITIGAGGASGSAGGDTMVGTKVTAYGGGAASGSGTGGGGGGSAYGKGTTATTSSGGAAGGPDAGAGGAANVAGNAASSFGGGGGGGAQTATSQQAGGKSIYGGGGGGGGQTGAVGGTSVYGGAGGNSGSAGNAPGGGGGANAVGARGEIRVTVFP